MTKFLAVIRADGRGKVINVASGQLRTIWSQEKAAGSTVIGEYSNPRTAEKAVALGLRGWRRPDTRKTA